MLVGTEELQTTCSIVRSPEGFFSMLGCFRGRLILGGPLNGFDVPLTAVTKLSLFVSPLRPSCFILGSSIISQTGFRAMHWYLATVKTPNPQDVHGLCHRSIRQFCTRKYKTSVLGYESVGVA